MAGTFDYRTGHVNIQYLYTRHLSKYLKHTLSGKSWFSQPIPSKLITIFSGLKETFNPLDWINSTCLHMFVYPPLSLNMQNYIGLSNNLL